MFCVALCVALSLQMTIVVLDRLQHVFDVDHAPNALAGPVFDHGHHLEIDVQRIDIAHVPDHSHASDDAAPAHRHSHAPDDAAPAHGHSHHDQHASGHAHDHDGAPNEGFHTHDWLPQGHDHGPITHHHHGSGMLTPWLVSAPPQLAFVPVRAAVFDYGVIGHPDAPAWRRDRPPKLNLERMV